MTSDAESQARAVAGVVIQAVTALPSAEGAVDVLCYCTAYLASRAGLPLLDVTQRISEYMNEAAELERAGKVALSRRRS